MLISSYEKAMVVIDREMKTRGIEELTVPTVMLNPYASRAVRSTRDIYILLIYKERERENKGQVKRAREEEKEREKKKKKKKDGG